MADSEVKDDKPKKAKKVTKATKIKKSKTKEMPAWNSPEAKELYVEYMQAKIADPEWVYGTALPKGFIPDTK
ncbi:hypothetical protein OAU20_03365 [Nitrosopumilus sp.]|jgi:hypothetical protein|nr:hypothetical protein [Nitrosopumilus sp.]